MKRLNDQELQNRIHTFMARKQREFPDLHLIPEGEEDVEVISVAKTIYKTA